LRDQNARSSHDEAIFDIISNPSLELKFREHDEDIPLMFAHRLDQLTARMVRILEDTKGERESDTEDEGRIRHPFFGRNLVPYLFYFTHLRGTNGASELHAIMQKGIESIRDTQSSQNGTPNSLKSAAEALPLVYFEALHQAIRQRQMSIEVKQGVVHWGSQIESLPHHEIEGRSLVDLEPIMSFDLFPDELSITTFGEEL